MKKWIALLLTVAMMLSLWACKGGETEDPQVPETTEAEPVETTTDGEEPTEPTTETTQAPTEKTEEPTETTEEPTETTQEPTETEIPSENETEETSEAEEHLEYPMAFYFSSGAGGWATELYLNEDGTFTGYFFDSNMGDIGEGYPYGTTYTCSFTGKFGSSEKLDDYSYSVKLEELTLDRPVGEEWIEGETRYISATPYGLEGGEDFLFYLPNTPITMLSEDQLFWWPGKYRGEYTTLHGYAIYNVADDSGFFSMIE